jgi:hypothetical protein
MSKLARVKQRVDEWQWQGEQAQRDEVVSH